MQLNRFKSSRVVFQLIALLLIINLASLTGAEIEIEGRSGPVDRQDGVIQASFRPDQLGLTADGPEMARLAKENSLAWRIHRKGSDKASAGIVQVEKVGDQLKLTWVEPGHWVRNESRQWMLETALAEEVRSPWKWEKTQEGQLELSHAKKGFVFRYNLTPINQKGLSPTQLRGGYIHPFMTPSGKVATGDFSAFHTHHRGFFLAYAKTKRESTAPDFWNIHQGTAKIVAQHDSVKTEAGPVVARLRVQHEWQLRDKSKPELNSGEKVLNETWDIAVYDTPGQQGWIWDLTSSQTPFGKDLELVKHRYGGMAYRGAEPFVKGQLDVLTSEGHDHRTKADQKPARWFDLTGPVAEGSKDYVGAVMCDHPENLRHPNVVRVHPVSLPFFSFVPAYQSNLNLKAGETSVWKYRTMVHDGHPDGKRDEALFQDFAKPVQVHVLQK